MPISLRRCLKLALALAGTAPLLPALPAGEPAQDPHSGASPRVRGTVRSAAGSGLAGARVELHPLLADFEEGRRFLDLGLGETEPAVTVSTDAGGRFELRAPRAGMWKLKVHGPGSVPVQLAPLPLVEDRELPPVTLPRDVGTSIEIVRTSEMPVAGVWAMAATSEDGPTHPLSQDDRRNGWRTAPRIGRSGESGTATLPRGEGEWLDFTVVFPWTAVPRQVLAVEGLRLVVEPGSPPSRRLELRGPDGAPAPGVLVRLGTAGWPVGITDVAGRLEIADRFDRRQPVQLSTASGRRRIGWLAAGAEPVKAVLPDRVEVCGRVVDLRRRGLPNALVWVGHDPGRSVWTDAGGGYCVSASRGERFWIQAEARGFLPRWDPVDPVAENPPGSAGGGTRPGPTLSLVSAAALEGQVVDTRGRPVADADVAAEVADPEQRPQAFRAAGAADRTRSRKDGSFRLAHLQAGIRHQLTVAREGYGTRTITVEWPPAAQSSDVAQSSEADGKPANREPLQVVLVPARAAYAYGRVVDLEEQPIAGAEVRLRPAAGDLERHHPRALAAATRDDDPFAGVTDGTGRYEISALPASTVDLVAEAPGYAPQRVPGIELPAAAAEVDLGTVVLEPGASLAGRVVDPDGAGIEGAAVWRIFELGNSATSARARLGGTPPEVLSAADGSFELVDLVPGREHHLLFHAEGYLADWRRGVGVPLAEPLTVVLRPGGAIRGRIVDERQRPVAGSRVEIQPGGMAAGSLEVQPVHSEHSRFALADEHGRFEIGAIAPGSYELEAFARAYRPSEPVDLEVRAGEVVDDLEVVLLRGATLEGRVTTVDGEPVADVRVMVGRPAAVTDGEGFYRVEGIPPGSRTVEIRHPVFNRERLEVEIEPGVNALDVALETGYPVRGRVIDEHGRPVSDVRIGLTGGHQYHDDATRSGADGSFHFPQVAGGTYDLRATRESFAVTDLPAALEVVDAPVEDLEVRLLPGAAIVGRITGLDVHELAELEVAARSRSAPGRRGSVDYEGEYRIRDLGDGDWQVRARLPGGRREVDGWVTIPPGAREATLDLAFDAGVALSGSVTHNGEPLGGARVALFGHDVDVRRQVVTDYRGSFRLEDLPEGRYRVDTSHPRELLVHNLDLALVGDREIEIAIRTARISGRVTSGASAAPVADAVVSLQQRIGPGATGEGGVFTVGSDVEGRFRLARVTRGTYRVTVRKDGFQPWEGLLEVLGDDETLQVSLAPTAGLELVVQLASGGRPPAVTVNVYDGGGRLSVAESRKVDEAGRARFPTVPAGRWHLWVAAPGQVPVRAVVTTPGEPTAVVLPEGRRLTVRVPALMASRQAASLSLLGIDGQPYAGLGSTSDVAQTSWRLTGGTAVVDGVPAGFWTVEVTAAGGQRWSRGVDLSASPSVEVSLE